MLRSATLAIVLLISVIPVASQENIYSDKVNRSTGYVDIGDDALTGFRPNFERDNVSLEISEIDRNLSGLKVYKSYRIKAENSNLMSLLLFLEGKGFESWVSMTDLEGYYSVITDSNSVIYINNSSEGYSADITSLEPEIIVHIAGADNINENFSYAVNPERTNCGVYWNPPANHSKVENCRGVFEDSYSVTDNLTDKILTILVIIALFPLLTIIYKRYENDSRDLVEKSSEIIDKMESGQIPKDKSLLRKLEKANENALNGENDKASELLNEVESQLNES